MSLVMQSERAAALSNVPTTQQEEDKLGEEVSHWQLSAQPAGDAIIQLPAHWLERDMWSTAQGTRK